MTRGLYTAYTGMLAQQMRMDVIANNLANVNSAGFKKDNVVFKSFYEASMLKIKDPEMPGAMKIGKVNYGVQMGDYYTNFEQGGFQETNSPFNLAIDGDGMFAVGKVDAKGDVVVRYTRDGSFSLNEKGQLVTKDGYFVMGENDEPIVLKDSGFIVTDKGSVLESDQKVNQIKLVNFEDMTVLEKIEGDYYSAPEDVKMKDFNGTIMQGFVEGSNVSSVSEMVEMINVMRVYEANQKVLTTVDETLNKAVNEIAR